MAFTYFLLWVLLGLTSGSPSRPSYPKPSSPAQRNASDVPCTGDGRGKCPKELIPIGEERRNFTLAMIRQDILTKLRLQEDRLPNITAIPSEYLATLTGFVGMQNDTPQDLYDDEHATTEKIIAFSKTQEVKVTGKGLKSAHYFSFSEKLSNGIDRATLYVLVKFSSQRKQELPIYIRVMQLVSEKKGESPVFNDYGAIKAILHPMPHGQTHFRHNSTHWVQVDVGQVFTKWLRSPLSTASRKLGLLLDVTDSSLNSLPDVSVVSANNINVNENPFVEVELGERGKSRQTRNIGLQCQEINKETRCCRYPLTVDFDEFGWDWVIAPKKYEANYCSGECPFAFLHRYPHNHIVQQAKPSGVGGPCCTARKLSPITMLHFDTESNIMMSMLPGMIVDQCGCS